MTFPPLPEAHAIAVIIFTLIALFLFTRDRIALETSSLAVITILAVGFSLFPMPEPAADAATTALTGKFPPIHAESFLPGLVMKP